jgi:hypothetical protein
MPGSRVRCRVGDGDDWKWNYGVISHTTGGDAIEGSCTAQFVTIDVDPPSNIVKTSSTGITSVCRWEDMDGISAADVLPVTDVHHDDDANDADERNKTSKRAGSNALFRLGRRVLARHPQSSFHFRGVVLDSDRNASTYTIRFFSIERLVLERSRVSLYTIREPSLIFHLDKKKIKQVISWMLSDRFSIKDWCDHEACSYLAPENMISQSWSTARQLKHLGKGCIEVWASICLNLIMRTQLWSRSCFRCAYVYI